jgi:cyclophilin family peptidyl-prolyl cis-trans isomerase
VSEVILGTRLTGNLKGASTIYGASIEDECFLPLQDRIAVLGAVNEGKSNSNTSDFFVTLRQMALPAGSRYVVFGRVLLGFDALRKAAKRCTKENLKPDLIITRCGRFSKKRHLQSNE